MAKPLTKQSDVPGSKLICPGGRRSLGVVVNDIGFIDCGCDGAQRSRLKPRFLTRSKTVHLRFGRLTNLLVWTKLFLATSAPLCFADQILEGYSVISGKEFAFEVKAPVGWVLDNEAARQQGLNLVFYPTGTNWQTSKVVIYVRVRSNDANVRNIEAQVDDTLRNLRATGSPNASVKYVKTLTTQDASKAKVYYYSGDKFGNFEATAYIQAKGTIHFLTLSARDQDTFQRALSAFNSVVTSYEDLKKSRTTESTRS
ncbi:MAG TPA: hypothetical protein VGY91_06375 [Chthoniobacterales bacterium]|jgi:hypothetical protein|nr:hypothetical protein [Chthoniobacterales bacterium]